MTFNEFADVIATAKELLKSKDETIASQDQMISVLLDNLEDIREILHDRNDDPELRIAALKDVYQMVRAKLQKIAQQEGVE